MSLPHHLFLIGYRGSGKTTVGRSLASLFEVECVDTDDWVERQTGKTIREIFASEGESSFRDAETAAIDKVAVLEPRVIALGGGAVLRDGNRETIRSHGRSVWLQASAAQLASRILGDPSTGERRPALSNLAGYDEIVHLLGIREPIYRELADLIVDTEGKSPEYIAGEIAEWLGHSNLR